jgi:hypothetical protein
MLLNYVSWTSCRTLLLLLVLILNASFVRLTSSLRNQMCKRNTTQQHSHPKVESKFEIILFSFSQIYNHDMLQFSPHHILAFVLRVKILQMMFVGFVYCR